MKPSPDRCRQFPATDYPFQSDLSGWRGSSWSGDDDSDFRRFTRFNREFFRQCEIERKREAIAFGIIVAVAAWPVIYMLISVAELLWQGHPLDH